MALHSSSFRRRATLMSCWVGLLLLALALPSRGSKEGAPLLLRTSSSGHLSVKETRPVHPSGGAPLATAQPPQNDTFSGLSGFVDDCCNCTYQAVDEINQAFVHPTLSALVRTAFFRYFKVNIHCDCPLWPDDGMCMLQACSVCACEPSEVPQPWLAAEARAGSGCSAAALGPRACDSVQCKAELESGVDRELDPDMRARLLNLNGWRGVNNPWMAEPLEEQEEFAYINLLANPERYTGYAGEHAARIWPLVRCGHRLAGPSLVDHRGFIYVYDEDVFSSLNCAWRRNSIYGQDVFSNLDCMEKVIFYRLISGMHASISAHLSANYLLDEQRNVWGLNLYEFQRRLGNPDVQSRVGNLYFSYLFVLQAVIKAGPLLEHFDYVTGLEGEDARAAALVRALVRSRSIEASCPRPFDEGRLWKGEASEQLKAQLQTAFQNITRVMDCVGCEKCKLWGKLQTLGIATALKILFSSSSEGPDAAVPPSLHLERNEVIALLNLMERFSSAIEYYRSMSQEVQSRGQVVAPVKPPTFSMFHAL